ncbi:MAG: acetate/propionate family kinase [Methylotenera sp.]
METFSILVFNAGSSSLKFALFEDQATGPLKSIVRGTINNIGGISSLDWTDGTTHAHIFIEASNHEDAADWVLDWLQHLWPFGSLLDNIGLVAHRIVHGGRHFCAPIVVAEVVMAQLESLTPLAPLHNANALAVMRASKKKFSRKVLTVAVFDTAFFRGLPQHTGYALPESMVKEHGIQRFGFHGLAHRYMIQHYHSLHPNLAPNHRIISFQLGHGCSVAASRDGTPVDTSMGFTPLEGLVMATRAGDIDPGVLIYLLNNGHKLDELEDKLQHHSGLLGVSKSTADMRELLARQDTDEDARLAIDMFCHRARKYLGSYMAILNGADVILFGGGIGEHAPKIRQRICADMAWCGLQLDEQRNHGVNQKANQPAKDTETLISADKSKIGVYVIPVNEEILIAEDAKTAAMNYKSGVINVIFSGQKY